jgi:hypothetical protein
MKRPLDCPCRFLILYAAMSILVALPGCAMVAKLKSDATPSKDASGRKDADMRPDRVLQKCASLGSGGNYVMDGKGMSFYLDRDSTSESIRKMQKLLASYDFTLGARIPHSAEVPQSSSALWMKITEAEGASTSLRVYNGTNFITSDGVNDWHWTGGDSDAYFKMVEALAPTSEEQHEDVAVAVTEPESAPVRSEAEPEKKAPIEESQEKKKALAENAQETKKAPAESAQETKKPGRTPVGTQQFRRALRR